MAYYLGNNRIVANVGGTVIQKNQFYPFGMAFAEGTTTTQGKQPYKYNGKELDQSHGLNQYDYSARFYDPGYARFTTMDPLSEKFYNWSPYVYCYNNPLKFVDKDGKQGILPVPGSAIPIPMASMAVPANQSTTNQLAEQGRTIKNTVSQAANLIQGATIIAGTKLLMDIGVLEASSNPGYTNQRKNDRVAKEGLDAAQAAVAKGIQDNMPSPSFDNGGGSDPKRPPQGTVSKIVAGVTAAVGVIQQVTNPDPSKDAHDAHLEATSKKINQQPQDPAREPSGLEKLIDWLKK